MAKIKELMLDRWFDKRDTGGSTINLDETEEEYIARKASERKAKKQKRDRMLDRGIDIFLLATMLATGIITIGGALVVLFKGAIYLFRIVRHIIRLVFWQRQF